MPEPRRVVVLSGERQGHLRIRRRARSPRQATRRSDHGLLGRRSQCHRLRRSGARAPRRGARRFAHRRRFPPLALAAARPLARRRLRRVGVATRGRFARARGVWRSTRRRRPCPVRADPLAGEDGRARSARAVWSGSSSRSGSIAVGGESTSGRALGRAGLGRPFLARGSQPRWARRLLRTAPPPSPTPRHRKPGPGPAPVRTGHRDPEFLEPGDMDRPASIAGSA
jgi:hypothetical protein